MDTPGNNSRWIVLALVLAVACGLAFYMSRTTEPEPQGFRTSEGTDATAPILSDDTEESVTAPEENQPKPAPEPTPTAEGQPAEADDQTNASAYIAGTVWDKTTREPIPGATVQLFEGKEGPYVLLMPDRAEAETETGDNGTYSFTNVSPGHYTVFVSGRAIGYVINADVAQTFDFDASVSKTGVDLWLEKGGTVQGRVVNSSGESVADAVVRAMPKQTGDDFFSAFNPYDFDPENGGPTSSESGEYEIQGIKFGLPVRILAQADGYAPAWSEAVTLSLTNPDAEAVLTLTEGSTVSGKVTYDDGTPASGVGVSLGIGMNDLMNGNYMPMEFAETDDTGQFIFDHIAAGKYEVVASDEFGGSGMIGFADGMFELDSSDDVRKVDVDGRTNVAGLTVVIERTTEGTGQITGIVLTENGTPASEIEVSAYHSDTWTDFEATTDANGNFALSKLKEGNYFINAASVNAYVDKDEVPMGSHVTLRLLPYLKVSGRVIDDAGDPVANARVQYEEVGDPFGFDNDFGTMTDANGAFTIDELDEDEYVFTAKNTLKGFGKTKTISLQRGRETPPVTITLVPGVKVSGIVVNAEGDTLPGATVSLVRQSDESNAMMFMQALFEKEEAAATTDGDGRFTLTQVPPGVYRLDADASGYAGGRIEDLEVGSRLDVKNLRIAMTMGGCLVGVAVNDDHSPRKGHMLQLVGDSGEFNTTTDSDGRFEICSIPEGNYMVIIVDIQAAVNSDGFGQPEFEARYVDIVDGETTEFDLKPPENGVQLTGILRGDVGPATTVSLRSSDSRSFEEVDPTDMDSMMKMMQIFIPKTASIDSEGRFNFGLVEPGDYVLEVRSMDDMDTDIDFDSDTSFTDFMPGLLLSEKVALEEGKPLELDLQLP